MPLDICKTGQADKTTARSWACRESQVEHPPPRLIPRRVRRAHASVAPVPPNSAKRGSSPCQPLRRASHRIQDLFFPRLFVAGLPLALLLRLRSTTTIQLQAS